PPAGTFDHPRRHRRLPLYGTGAADPEPLDRAAQPPFAARVGLSGGNGASSPDAGCPAASLDRTGLKSATRPPAWHQASVAPSQRGTKPARRQASTAPSQRGVEP